MLGGDVGVVNIETIITLEGKPVCIGTTLPEQITAALQRELDKKAEASK